MMNTCRSRSPRTTRTRTTRCEPRHRYLVSGAGFGSPVEVEAIRRVRDDSPPATESRLLRETPAPRLACQAYVVLGPAASASGPAIRVGAMRRRVSRGEAGLGRPVLWRGTKAGSGPSAGEPR